MRDTEETVTRDASVAAAAAALAKALVEGTTIPSSRSDRLIVCRDVREQRTALARVWVILTRAARGATGARALNLPGLIEASARRLSASARAACAEDADAARGGRHAALGMDAAAVKRVDKCCFSGSKTGFNISPSGNRHL